MAHTGDVLSIRHTCVVPDPSEDERGLLQFLMEAGESLQTRPVLIPTNDAFLLFMSKNSDALSKYYDFNVADYPTVMTLVSKRMQYEYAQSQGISIPRTLYPSNVPIEEIAREMSYPCIIKPCFSHLWRKFLSATWETRDSGIEIFDSPRI